MLAKGRCIPGQQCSEICWLYETMQPTTVAPLSSCLHKQTFGMNGVCYSTVASHARHGVAHHRPLDSLTACTNYQQRKQQGSASLDLCEGNCPVARRSRSQAIDGFPSQRPSISESVFMISAFTLGFLVPCCVSLLSS